MCAYCLQNSLEIIPTRIISHALNKDLLSCIAGSCHAVKTASHKLAETFTDLYDCMIKVLARYLAYPRILSAANVAMIKLYSKDDKFKFETQPLKGVLDSWQNYTAAIIRMQNRRIQYKATTQVCCMNLECKVSMIYDVCKRCGGCMSKLYCSKKCQAQDWAAGHDKGCLQLASSRIGAYTSTTEDSYFKWLVRIIFKEMCEQGSLRESRTGQRPWIVKVNYIATPVNVSFASGRISMKATGRWNLWLKCSAGKIERTLFCMESCLERGRPDFM
ncbi:hypothetical protein C8J56DRAFT_932377, partial [Mycena floridula]